MSTVTLSTGREVDSASPEWMQECRQRHEHVQTMRGMDLQARRMYLEQVGKAEGQEASRRLAEAFTRDWERRKAEREGARG